MTSRLKLNYNSSLLPNEIFKNFFFNYFQYSASAERDAADDYNENSMGTNTFSYDSFADQTTKEDTGDMSFCMSNYPKDAMKMMSMMRSHHMLTDVVLEVQKELFHAHKVILSAASPYFKAMFTGGLKESEMSRVKLEGVSVFEQ